MKAVRIQTHLNSDTLCLPDVKPMIGRDVEIIILAEPETEHQQQASVHQRQPGSARGQFSMSDDFTAPLDPEIIERFYA